MSNLSQRTIDNGSPIVVEGQTGAVADSLVKRDSTGSAAFTSVVLSGAPTAANQATTKSYVDSALVAAAPTSLTGDASGPLTATQVNSLANGTIPVSNLVQLDANQSLTNKTLTNPVIGSFVNGAGSLISTTLPGGPDTMVTANATQTLTNKTITGTTNTVDANTLRYGSTYAVALAGAAPTANQVLTYNGTNAVFQTPAAPVTSVTMGGDVTSNSGTSVVNTLANGTLPVSNLVTLAGSNALTNKTITGTTNSVDANTLRYGSTYAVALAGAAPTANQVLTYNGTKAVFQTPAAPVTSVPTGGDVTSNSGTSVVNTLANGYISSHRNLTLPTSMDTLVGRTIAASMTNKTITGTTNTVDANTLRYGSTYAVALAGAAPTANQVLTYNGTNAVFQTPAAPVTSVTMGGDVTSNSGTSVVNTLANGTVQVSNLVTLAGRIL